MHPLVRTIVPTLCVGMHPVTLCVTLQKRNAERPWRRSHAEREERSFKVVGITQPVARGFIPAGLRSSPKKPRSRTQDSLINPKLNPGQVILY